MVKLETYQRKRGNPDFRKCSIAAAILSALIVFGIELAGGPVTPANARLGVPAPGATGDAPATAPASAPR
jgi:hypothetical protein